MNLLPLIFAFILIFSLLTTGLLRQEIRSAISTKSIESFYTLSRDILNKQWQKQHNKITNVRNDSTATEKKPTPSATKKPKKHSSLRTGFPPKEMMKSNLLPLLQLQTNPQDHPLYEVNANLLRLLYEENLFKQTTQTEVEYAILNALIKSYYLNKEAQTLCEFVLETEELKKIYYKMLRGTNQYEIKTGKGIPPLEDFFCLASNKPAIYFTFASPPLLEALLGKKGALTILEREKQSAEKKPMSAQDQLSDLDPAIKSFILELGSYISFSQENAKITTHGKRDETTGLAVKKKLIYTTAQKSTEP